MALTPSLRRLEVSASLSQSFSGPLPPPEVLAQYDELMPGGAQRIISLAEEQARHRMGLENFVVKSESTRSFQGLVAGVVVAISFLLGAVVLGLNGQPTAGTIIGTVDIVSLASVFVYGNVSRRQERQVRAENMTGRSNQRRR